jgi:hypothetical protein
MLNGLHILRNYINQAISQDLTVDSSSLTRSYTFPFTFLPYLVLLPKIPSAFGRLLRPVLWALAGCSCKSPKRSCEDTRIRGEVLFASIQVADFLSLGAVAWICHPLGSGICPQEGEVLLLSVQWLIFPLSTVGTAASSSAFSLCAVHASA